MFTLHIDSQLPRYLGGLVRALTATIKSKPQAMRKAAARGAEQLTKDHFFDLAAKRHRPNVRLNFYEDAADATQGHVLSDGIEVIVDKAGAAQRYHGGKIEAVNYPYLWIPVSPRSEGHTGGDFDVYTVISALTNTGVAIETATDEVLVALVESVEQDPDPSVLPTPTEYQEAPGAAIDALIDADLRRNVETRWAAGGS
jgi:hypothetical protein